jgi:hypothetical protein
VGPQAEVTFLRSFGGDGFKEGYQKLSSESFRGSQSNC